MKKDEAVLGMRVKMNRTCRSYAHWIEQGYSMTGVLTGIYIDEIPESRISFDDGLVRYYYLSEFDAEGEVNA